MEALIAQIVESTFAQKWAALTTPPPVKYANVAFRQPANGIWVSLTIKPGSAFQASMGNTFTSRELGIVLFQIFTPKNVGDRQAKKISDNIAGIFRGQQWGYDANLNFYLKSGALTTVQMATQPLTTEGGVPITTEGGVVITTEPTPAEMMFTILFREPRAQEVPGGRDYYQLNFVVPYQADQVNQLSEV